MTVKRLMTTLASATILGAAVLVAAHASTTQRGDAASIARIIKADVAQFIAGINAHDVSRATSFDAPDVVSMECGRPTSAGLGDEQSGLAYAFRQNPDWRVRLIDETVDVARAGDMAVYRGTYFQDSSKAGAPTTQRVNFVAGFKRQGDEWKVAWSVVAPMEAMHAR